MTRLSFLPKAKLVLMSSLYFSLTLTLLYNPHPSFAKVRTSGKNTVEPSKQNFDTGMTKYKDHDLDGAIDGFLQSIYFTRNSYNPDAYYWLGMSYQEKNLDAKAIEAFKKCVEQSIKPAPKAHLHLAQLYMRNNRLDEAEYEANKALADYNGPGPEAHNIIGLISEKRGDLSRAQDQFVEALGDPPWRYTEAWMNYAENLMKQKQWGYAITQLRKMLNHTKALKGMDPQRIYLDIGICLLAKGDHQGAMDNWHEVLNYNPDNAAAHLQLALLLDSERHLSAAIREYKEYIRLSADNPQIAKIKNQVLLLEQKLRSGSADVPVQNSTRYSTRSPLEPTTVDLRRQDSDNTEAIETTTTDRNKKSKKAEKKKDSLEPKSGKESGF
jgi:tetratricopeptide (TPR) repeat protein